jgi:DNA topoisomerase-1
MTPPVVEKAAPRPVRRKGKLVIVESPAKAKTIEHYLGKEYRVRASVGHVRDLLKSQLSVDVENNFEPRYRILNDKRDIVKELKSAAAQAEEVYLATDPDREGEAIAWHLIHAAEMDEDRVHRVVFHEITRDAVQEAFKHPRAVNVDLVNAQQARRILDRLVGYELSPLLWQKIRPRLSAGRVQSVAVRLIVEREREIEGFVPVEYWTIDAELARAAERSDSQRRSFTARLFRINGQEISLPTQGAVEPIVRDLEKSEYVVDEIRLGQRKRKPAPPFTTSTLQQEASRRLGFTARRAMNIAQQLYEGVAIDQEGEVGLITYMRTDSTNISEQARAEAKDFIVKTYGKEYYPDPPNAYGKKSKGAQEAHEAVRPTGVMRSPEAIKPHLSKDQFNLYRLIWQRFVASQMEQAVYDTISVDILAGLPGGSKPYLLRTSGSTLRFPGFLAVYGDVPDEENPEDSDLNRIFPALVNGDPLDLLDLLPEQHFTQPPPRFTEASLVKAMEEDGIGRPSTYAPILNTIQERGYVLREGKLLLPTEVGVLVNDLLVAFFPDVVGIDFTARMEDQLDQIASGEQAWVPLISEFYVPFKSEVQRAFAEVPAAQLESEQVGRDCPTCGSPLIIRWGRFGKFIGCSTFPTCRYTEPWLEKMGVACPLDGGDLIERRSKRGKVFYGCANYPTCEWTSWKKPLPDPCPQCGGLLVVHNKEKALCTACNHMLRLDELASAEMTPAS